MTSEIGKTALVVSSSPRPPAPSPDPQALFPFLMVLVSCDTLPSHPRVRTQLINETIAKTDTEHTQQTRISREAVRIDLVEWHAAAYLCG